MVLRAWFQGGLIPVVAFPLVVVAVLAATFRAIAREECGTEASVLVAALAYGLVLLAYGPAYPVLEHR